MKNLEKFNVEELKNEEISTIKGGGFPAFLAGLSYLFDVGGIRGRQDRLWA